MSISTENATASNLGSDAESHGTEQSSTQVRSTTYLCNSCHISFRDGPEQRLHMKEPWHICNIKRRIESLPPIPRNEFDVQIKQQVDSSKASISSSNSSGDEEEIVTPFQCLFCNEDFASDDAGFATNLEHMRAIHDMIIPDSEMVEDMQSLVGYLATEVRTWHECLYCGATKPSTMSIQSHMRDKRHCRLNVDREPELLDFWEPGWIGSDDVIASDQEPPSKLSGTEIRLASGKILASRHAALLTKKAPGKRDLATEASPAPFLPRRSEVIDLSPLTIGPQLPSSRQIARRDEMSLSGISSQRRQGLVLAEKKAQRSEAVARRAREWASAKGANLQKYDQVDTTAKMGKQNHKLQPR